MGFKSVDKKLVNKVHSDNFFIKKFFPVAGKSNLFNNTIQGFQAIENFNELKNLYIRLSKKESHFYCLQYMQKRFTKIFIGYKDLLK